MAFGMTFGSLRSTVLFSPDSGSAGTEPATSEPIPDRHGRIVFTCSKGLPGVGFSRAEWNEIREMKSGTVERKVTEDFLPGGPRERTIDYEAPFDRCDREQDYATVWKEFESR